MISVDQKAITIHSGAQLDFSQLNLFINVLSAINCSINTKIVVDMKNTEVVHDSGLSLLLMLRNKIKKRIDLINLNEGLFDQVNVLNSFQMRKSFRINP